MEPGNEIGAGQLQGPAGARGSCSGAVARCGSGRVRTPLTAGCPRPPSRRGSATGGLDLNTSCCWGTKKRCRIPFLMSENGIRHLFSARGAIPRVRHAVAHRTGNCDPRGNARIAVATAAWRAALLRTGAARGANHKTLSRARTGRFLAIPSRNTPIPRQNAPKLTCNSASAEANSPQRPPLCAESSLLCTPKSGIQETRSVRVFHIG